MSASNLSAQVVGANPRDRPGLSQNPQAFDSPHISPMKHVEPPPPISPYEMKAQDRDGRKLIPTTRAFQKPDFLLSGDARIIRILCEFQEPAQRLARNDIRGTILFFGSARSMSRANYDQTKKELDKKLADAGDDALKKAEAEQKIVAFNKVEWMCPYVDIVQDLSQRLTQWSRTDERLRDLFSATTNYLTGHSYPGEPSEQPLIVTTGGGPGIMEAANKGARSVYGATTMGMGISLPFEKGLNPYVTEELAFEFHYFFTRKFWMMYSARALILGPGGFGTLDELFELLTLRQTGKVEELPIVLLGAKFWKTAVNWQALADFGTVSQKEVDNLFFTDDADAAYDYLTTNIIRLAEARQRR